MENLDSTVLSTALPAIAAGFRREPDPPEARAHLLSPCHRGLPPGLRLARRPLRRAHDLSRWRSCSSRSARSSAASPARSARWSSRAIVQGIGGAMMVPVGRLVILKSVPKHELVGSLAWLTVPALIGPVIGPPLGGFITTYFHWRWIFWINVPVGLLGLVLATLFIPDLRGEDARRASTRSASCSPRSGLAAFMTGSTSLGLGLLPLWLTLGAVPRRRSAALRSTSSTAGASPIRSSTCRSSASRPSRMTHGRRTALPDRRRRDAVPAAAAAAGRLRHDAVQVRHASPSPPPSARSP